MVRSSRGAVNTEILSAAPTSGRFVEYTFGNSVEYLWVKFDDGELEEWVGAFASGDQLHSYAAVSGSNAMVPRFSVVFAPWRPMR